MTKRILVVEDQPDNRMADIHDRMPPGCSILLRLIQRGKPHHY